MLSIVLMVTHPCVGVKNTKPCVLLYQQDDVLFQRSHLCSCLEHVYKQNPGEIIIYMQIYAYSLMFQRVISGEAISCTQASLLSIGHIFCQ